MLSSEIDYDSAVEDVFEVVGMGRFHLHDSQRELTFLTDLFDIWT